MNNLLGALSLIVVALLFAVIVAFVRRLTRTLQRTGEKLATAQDIAGAIRLDCEDIIGAVVGLNRNLGMAAEGLTDVANAARQRAASVRVTGAHAAPLSAATDPAPAPNTLWRPS